MALISLQNVHLEYPVLHANQRTLRDLTATAYTGGELASTGNSGRASHVRALEDISLHIGDGERVAIIGHNGSGKTTLLRVMAGLYPPTSGKIRREGKTVSVINPSVGLNMSLTGRENVRNLCLLAGLSQREANRLIPDIAEFTELGAFLDLPVATYSSGMTMRLAFATVTSLNPTILITDENLSTGDARFQERAQHRMTRMMDRSSIVVIGSHSIGVVRRLCDRAILLEKGRITEDGPIEKVLAGYEKRALRKSA